VRAAKLDTWCADIRAEVARADARSRGIIVAVNNGTSGSDVLTGVSRESPHGSARFGSPPASPSSPSRARISFERSGTSTGPPLRVIARTVSNDGEKDPSGAGPSPSGRSTRGSARRAESIQNSNQAAMPRATPQGAPALSTMISNALWRAWVDDEDDALPRAPRRKGGTARGGLSSSRNTPQVLPHRRLRRDDNGSWVEEVSDDEESTDRISVGGGGGGVAAGSPGSGGGGGGGDRIGGASPRASASPRAAVFATPRSAASYLHDAVANPTPPRYGPPALRASSADDPLVDLPARAVSAAAEVAARTSSRSFSNRGTADPSSVGSSRVVSGVASTDTPSVASIRAIRNLRS
jgi:hypothetical protein